MPDAEEMGHEQRASGNDVIAPAGAARVDPLGGEGVLDSAAESLAHRRDPRINFRAVSGQMADHPQTGPHILGVGGIRPARESDRGPAAGPGQETFEDVRLSHDRGDGMPAPDRFAECRQIGFDAGQAPDSGRGESESGNDLVENEDDPQARCPFPGRLKIFPVGRDESSGAEIRLQDETGDFLPPTAEKTDQAFGVVVADGVDLLAEGGRNTRRLDFRKTQGPVVGDPLEKKRRGAVPAAADL